MPSINPPPSIPTLQLVNDGSEGFYNEINGSYFIAYSSLPQPTDIIGNTSADGTHFLPLIPNTDPPSHFIFIEKDFSTNCAFYPSVDSYNGFFSIAWLETTPVGRLNLKYANVGNLTGFTPPPPLPVPKPTNVPTVFYVYPYVALVGQHVKTENIPLFDIECIDVHGHKFTIDTKRALATGVEVTLNSPVVSFRWTQTFRQKTNNVVGILTNIPMQKNNLLITPLPGMTINIYHSHNGLLLQSVQTDEKGLFQVQLSNSQYTFEVINQGKSIQVSQQLL